MSSLPLTSEDLLRYRRVLDEALAADRLDSAQYRTRIRSLVLAVNKRDLNALIQDLVPAVGEPGFSDEGHEVPSVLSSVPVVPKPRPWETLRTSEPSPIDSFPSFPGEEELPGEEEDFVPDESTTYPDEDGTSPDEAALDEETTRMAETRPDEDGASPDEADPDEDATHWEKSRSQVNEESPEPVMAASPELLDEDSPATHVVPVVPSAPPAVSVETVPGELVPVRQWSAEVSSVEQTSTSTALSPVGQKPTTEISRVGQRPAEVAQVESLPEEKALSPVETDDDGSVNRVVVFMVPSAPSPDEPNVITSSWDELLAAVPASAASPVQPAESFPVEPAPAAEAMAAPEPEPEDTEDAETVTRISAPMNFDDSEAPTQVLDAIKDLSIFREEAAPAEEIVEPPQPVLPYSANQTLSSTPADPMAQTAPPPSTGYAVPQMPPPIPEPSPATLAAMPPPAPPAPNPAQEPWNPYGPDPLATMPPPPEPTMTASLGVDPGRGAVPAASPYVPPPSAGQYAVDPMPPPSIPYQPPAPIYSSEPYGSEPAARPAPKRRGVWAWIVVTLMVLALLAWIAYLVFFPQARRSASEPLSQPREPGPVVVAWDDTSE